MGQSGHPSICPIFMLYKKMTPAVVKSSVHRRNKGVLCEYSLYSIFLKLCMWFVYGLKIFMWFGHYCHINLILFPLNSLEPYAKGGLL